MRKSLLIFLLPLAVFFIEPQLSAKGEPLLNSKKEEKIFINNRILARINGKSISTYDIVKKMDLAFYRQYPQYAEYPEARIQYYQMNWKMALSEMIDKELILMDGKDCKLTVSSGDLRQEIESSFGPNIIANLDKAGLTYAETAKLMEDEIIIRKILTGRVHAKVLRQVTPTKIKAAYEEFIKDPNNRKQTTWTYRVITVKDRNVEQASEVANSAYELLQTGVPLEQLNAKLKGNKVLGKKSTITISSSFTHNDKEVSGEYNELLSALQEGQFSKPFKQKSRSNQATVFRILALEKNSPGGMPTYAEMENTLKEKLIDDEVDKESDLYIAKLRQRHRIGIEEVESQLPAEYEPFMLK